MNKMNQIIINGIVAKIDKDGFYLNYQKGGDYKNKYVYCLCDNLLDVKAYDFVTVVGKLDFDDNYNNIIVVDLIQKLN